MHRFYIAPENWNPGALTLGGAEAHHARDVLRMERGARVVVFNGRGREITAEIVDLAKGEIRLRKLHETETPPLRCRIILGQAIPKGKNMDLIVQKAVESAPPKTRPLSPNEQSLNSMPKRPNQSVPKCSKIRFKRANQGAKNGLP